MIKKLLSFSAASVFTAFAVTAQNAIPNAGFETWSGGNPTGWTTLNTFVSGSAVQANAANSHGGSSAVELTTKSSILGLAPGVVATGTLDIATTSFRGGVPFNLRPDSLTGWYKYAPAGGGDAAFFSAFLFKRNGAVRDTVAKAVYVASGTVANYTYFKVEFNYLLGVTPDSAQFIMTSSGETGGVLNTKVWIDDLGLVYNPAVGVDDLSASDKIAVYPNPVSENLFVNMAGVQGANVAIFDITGKKVMQSALTEKVNNINVAALAKGMYVYQVNNSAKETLKTGKFIVK